MGLIAKLIRAKQEAQTEAGNLRRQRDQLETANAELVQQVDGLEKELASPEVIRLDDEDKLALATEPQQ